jgi:hypothetical protein
MEDLEKWNFVNTITRGISTTKTSSFSHVVPYTSFSNALITCQVSNATETLSIIESFAAFLLPFLLF